MDEIKFRYRFKNRKTGEVITQILTIEQVESCPFTPNPFEGFDWETVFRDRYSTKNDKVGTEIYENDIVEEPSSPHEPITLRVVFGGPYNYSAFGVTGKRVGGFGADPTWDTLTDKYCEHLRVVGMVHDNPELLEAI